MNESSPHSSTDTNETSAEAPDRDFTYILGDSILLNGFGVCVLTCFQLLRFSLRAAVSLIYLPGKKQRQGLRHYALLVLAMFCLVYGTLSGLDHLLVIAIGAAAYLEAERLQEMRNKES